MLNIHELQVFIVAAETQNFSEAGRRLNLSQPAVSMRIRGLETVLGVELFNKVGRNVALTEAGQILAPMARELVNQAIRIQETMASLQGQVVGMLKIGCSTTIGKYILPKLLAGLREMHEMVQVTCHVTSRANALHMLVEGQVQVALTSLREPNKDMEYRPFLTDEIILVAPPDHPWAVQGGLIKPADLTQGKFIFREEGAGTLEAVRDGLAWHDLSLDHLDVVMTLGNSEAIRMAVQERIGVAFISLLVAAEGITANTLVPISVEGLTMHQTIYMARHTGHAATRAQMAFWEYAFSPESQHLRQAPANLLEMGNAGRI
jgi:DNA-binding transcriptional LysR family regulator